MVQVYEKVRLEAPVVEVLESVIIFNTLTETENVLGQMQNIYQFFILLIFTVKNTPWEVNWKRCMMQSHYSLNIQHWH